MAAMKRNDLKEVVYTLTSFACNGLELIRNLLLWKNIDYNGSVM